MIDLAESYKGKRVFVTGSAGFKGRALVQRLVELGAWVQTFDIVEDQDVCDARLVRAAVARTAPDAVFHLAAQAFVPVGYGLPRATWEVNVDGTVNVLDALRYLVKPCAAVFVTTDKVYGACPDFASEARALFARCPYSASKVAAEFAVEAYRSSFFAPGHRIAVATARGGNVIGPGDAGPGRLIPNALRALAEGRPVPVYHPEAVRPWQYIDDVIEGYLLLGAALMRVSNLTHPSASSDAVCAAWNFGPQLHYTVREVVEALIKAWGSGSWAYVRRDLHEVDALRIDSSKARALLGWEPKRTLRDAAEMIVAAHRSKSGR